MGIKGHPDVNRNIDTDVIVAEVRETSRKPDEVSFGISFSASHHNVVFVRKHSTPRIIKHSVPALSS